MTVKLVVLYTTPADPAAFDEHYLSVHAPLARAMPGLQHFESGRFIAAADGADLSYYRVAELTFADQGALAAASASPQGQQTVADYQQIAPEGSRMFVSATDE